MFEHQEAVLGKSITKGCRRNLSVERKKQKMEQIRNNLDTDYNLVINEVFNEAVDTETSSLQKKYSLCGEDGHFSTTCKKSHNGFGALITTKDQNNAVNEGHLTIEIGNVGQTFLPQNK